jgi:ABC-type spermidine/putrescine transport system, permease component I
MIFPLISFLLTSLYGQPLSILEFRLNLIHNLTLKYFLYILNDPYYYDSIYHTLELSLAVTIASFLLALPISYGMSFMNIPFKKTIKSLIISGISIPGLITTYALIIIATNFGLFRYQLYSFYGLMAVMTISSLPFMVIYQTIAFDSIDTRLLEAATVHGLSKLRTFRKIVLPLLMPGFATSILIVFLLNTGTLSVPLLLAPSNFQVISELAFVQLFSFYNWGIAQLYC